MSSMSNPEPGCRWVVFGALVMGFVASACGRTEVFSSSVPPTDAGTEPVCLELCLEVEQELRDIFGVADPCTERAWAKRAFDCEACAQLFVDFYGVALETSACRDCHDEVPNVYCGTPPPACPLGSRPGTSGHSKCGPSFTGECVPCSTKD